MTNFAMSPATRQWRSQTPLTLELGDVLASYTLAYRTWGRLSPGGDNAVIVCHALTGSADADAWWEVMFGANKAFDPARDFIICSNALGSCYGSTGPSSADDPKQRGPLFPSLTIRDQVRAQMALADALGVERIRLVVGGSMGGLQALEWALMDVERVQALGVIAASARHSAWCLSWSEAQRMSLRADSAFCGGNYSPDNPPIAGLGAARAIAMATYRSPESLDSRYGRDKCSAAFGEGTNNPDEFAVRDWMRHHAETFVRRFDANSYLTLMDAMDRHDVGRGRGGMARALAGIRQPALVVAISSDGLYVPAEQGLIANSLPDAHFVELESTHGHDAFLIEADRIEHHLSQFRRRNHPVPGRPQAVNTRKVATYAR